MKIPNSKNIEGFTGKFSLYSLLTTKRLEIPIHLEEEIKQAGYLHSFLLVSENMIVLPNNKRNKPKIP